MLKIGWKEKEKAEILAQENCQKQQISWKEEVSYPWMMSLPIWNHKKMSPAFCFPMKMTLCVVQAIFIEYFINFNISKNYYKSLLLTYHKSAKIIIKLLNYTDT